MSDGDAKKRALELKEDFRRAKVSAQDMAMLEYAEKVTLDPSHITREDVDNLRAHGFDDREILEIATLSAYRNYIARVANALGVEVDDVHFADDAETRAALEKGLF
ncbi:MAG: carboxymuconolactone decarboxylase family protein [Nitrospinota bacterium]